FRWQQQSKSDEYIWKRQDLAIQLLRDWDEKTTAHRAKIDRLQAKLEGIKVAARMPPIKKELADKLWQQQGYDDGNQEEEARFQLRSELISLLNYFDSVAVAYNTQAANQQLIAYSLKDSLLRWQGRLRAFTNAAKEAEGGNEVWEAYDHLMTVLT